MRSKGVNQLNKNVRLFLYKIYFQKVKIILDKRYTHAIHSL